MPLMTNHLRQCAWLHVQFVRVVVCLSVALLTFDAQAKEFHVEGSDLLIGVGADAIAKSGAVTAGINSISSVYWNPAGLAELENHSVSLSTQINAKILPINFASIAFTNDWLDAWGLKSAIALSWIPRLHVKSSGAYSGEDIESIFLRFTLPSLPDTFSGDIESKTKDTRLTFAVMPKEDASWSLGLSVSKVDCVTFFCGVTAHEPDQYIISSTKATAYAFGIGAKYFASESSTYAFNLKDMDTTLDVDIKTEYQDGTVKHYEFNTAFPKDFTIGGLWMYQPNVALSLDYQTLFGHYGIYKMDFRILRAGLEYTKQSFAYRFGLAAPLKIEADKVSDYSEKLPFPIAPSVGVGWKDGDITIDAALYVQLVMSAQREKILPGLDISISSQF